MDEQQQEQAAFERGFSDTVDTEPQVSTDAPQDAPAETAEDVQPVEQASSEAVEATQAEGVAEGEQTAEGKPAAEAKPEDDDPVLLDGLRRSELHRLLSNAAEVEGLKRLVDKAHGHIGDLNRKIQQAQQSGVQVGQRTSDVPPNIQQFEEDYPEIAQYVRAMGITPKSDSQPAGDAQPETGALLPMDPLMIELAVMDRMHKGWREKTQSQDFNLWLAAQGEQAKQAFYGATTADELAQAIGQFDQWIGAKTAAADKVAKGQQRLRAAVTPSGNAQRPMASLTEQQIFDAAFNS